MLVVFDFQVCPVLTDPPVSSVSPELPERRANRAPKGSPVHRARPVRLDRSATRVSRANKAPPEPLAPRALRGHKDPRAISVRLEPWGQADSRGLQAQLGTTGLWGNLGLMAPREVQDLRVL